MALGSRIAPILSDSWASKDECGKLSFYVMYLDYALKNPLVTCMAHNIDDDEPCWRRGVRARSEICTTVSLVHGLQTVIDIFHID